VTKFVERTKCLRCKERVTPGGVYCAAHREEALDRVVRDERPKPWPGVRGVRIGRLTQ
jgi:hypothetical protein